MHALGDEEVTIVNRFETYSESMWYRERHNRGLVRSACVPITVTPQELAAAVDEDGIDSFKSRKVIEHLIKRSEKEALAKTLGVDPAQFTVVKTES